MSLAHLLEDAGVRLYPLPPAPLTLVQLLEDLRGAMRVKVCPEHSVIEDTQNTSSIYAVHSVNLGGRRTPRLVDEPWWD